MSNFLKNIFIKCEQSNHICNKAQYEEATLLDKVKHVIHNLFCGACKEYTKKNVKLSKVIKQSKSNVNLDQSTKNKMEDELKKAIELQKN